MAFLYSSVEITMQDLEIPGYDDPIYHLVKIVE